MPIVEAVNEVLFDNKPAEEAMWSQWSVNRQADFMI